MAWINSCVLHAPRSVALICMWEGQVLQKHGCKHLCVFVRGSVCMDVRVRVCLRDTERGRYAKQPVGWKPPPPLNTFSSSASLGEKCKHVHCYPCIIYLFIHFFNHVAPLFIPPSSVAVWNSYKYFWLPTWMDDTSSELVLFKLNLSLRVYSHASSSVRL